MRPEVSWRVDFSSAPPCIPYVEVPPSSFRLPYFYVSSPSRFLFFFPLPHSCRCVILGTVHGRVRRLCRLYFTLCLVRKRIMSSLFSSLARGGGCCLRSITLSLSLSFFLSWDTRPDSWRERESDGTKQGDGGAEGEREVSGGYASLFTGAPLFPIIRCD